MLGAVARCVSGVKPKRPQCFAEPGVFAFPLGRHEPQVADARGAEIATGLLPRGGTAQREVGHSSSDGRRKRSGSLVLETSNGAALEPTPMRCSSASLLHTFLGEGPAAAKGASGCPWRNGGRK
jgi:hypothetical protein